VVARRARRRRVPRAASRGGAALAAAGGAPRAAPSAFRVREEERLAQPRRRRHDGSVERGRLGSARRRWRAARDRRGRCRACAARGAEERGRRALEVRREHFLVLAGDGLVNPLARVVRRAAACAAWGGLCGRRERRGVRRESRCRRGRREIRRRRGVLGGDADGGRAVLIRHLGWRGARMRRLAGCREARSAEGSDCQPVPAEFRYARGRAEDLRVKCGNAAQRVTQQSHTTSWSGANMQRENRTSEN
jgi:hypothetical protein